MDFKLGDSGMKTLKYWYITGFRKGEWKGCMAHGIVHGHQRLADGILIHTSAISAVTVERDMAIIRTKNSEYHCRLDEASFELFDEQGRDFLPGFENLREKYERRLEVPGQGDGALIVLDREAEYYFVGAAYRCDGEVIEVRVPSIHLGMVQDSVLMDCFIERTEQAIDYRYFPFPGRVEFYSWMNDFDAYIVNAGAQPIKVMIKAQEYAIEPGNTIRIPGIKDGGGEGDV